MKCEILCVILGFAAVALAMPFELDDDDLDGDQYLIVPLPRVRRQTIGGSVLPGQNGGVSATIRGGGTIAENDKHRLDGSAFAQRDYHPKGPLTTGGQLDYTHKPSGSGLSVGTSNTRGFGQDLNVNGRYNIYSSKNADLGLTGQYNRHYGGPWGTGKPNYSVGLGGQYRF